MPEIRSIILVGLPGSGKSTAGRALADQLGLTFLDLDKVIEEAEGATIPEVFSKKGEKYFREQEAACLRNVLEAGDGLVLATGGGAPCFHDNMGVIQQKGLSVYLEVPFEVLAERLFVEGVEKRPLLEGVKSSEALVKLLNEKFAYRLPYYKKADLHYLNTSDSFQELVQKIQASSK